MTDKARLEAFSDGVLAIAITLLILEIRVPDPGVAGGLAHYLTSQWSSYAAYLLSFVVIGIMWVNHHALLGTVARVDRPLLLLNLHLLLWIAFLPFPTALVARFFRHGHDAEVAMAVYSAAMFACGVAFQLLWRWTVHDARLLHSHIDHEAARANTARFSVGCYIYLAAVGLSFVSPVATLAVHFAVAGYYLFDQLTPRITSPPVADA